MKFKDILLEAVLIVALLLGASVLTSGQTKQAVDDVRMNTQRTAQYIQAQTCLLSKDIDERADAVSGCYAAAGLSPDAP